MKKLHAIWDFMHTFVKNHIIAVFAAFIVIVVGVILSVIYFNNSNNHFVRTNAVNASDSLDNKDSVSTITDNMHQDNIKATINEHTTSTNRTSEKTSFISVQSNDIITSASKPTAPKPTNPPAPKTTTKQTTTTTTVTPTQPTKKDAWVYPYDLDAIYAETRAYVESQGMIWHDDMSKDNSHWTTPRNTVPYTSGEMLSVYNTTLKQKIIEAVDYYKDTGFTAFKLYMEPDTEYPGDYWVYCLVA